MFLGLLPILSEFYFQEKLEDCDCLRVILFKYLSESSNINTQSEICFTHKKCYTRPREMV